MIELSNTDAEKVCGCLEKRLNVLREKFKNREKVSVPEINEARILGILLKKINRKLDKACPGRHENQKCHSKQIKKN